MARDKQSCNGNVLFLILIAVALFAALSYAVTQSSRSTGGNASSEKAELEAASIIAYQSTLRLAVDRMVMSGISADDIDFSRPQDAAYNTAPYTNKIFHPQGGGVAYQDFGTQVAMIDWNEIRDYAYLVARKLNPISTAYALGGFQADNGGNGLEDGGGGPDIILTVPPDDVASIKGGYLGRFNNIGWSPTAAKDIVFANAKISQNVCRKLNEKLIGSSAIPVVSSPERYLVDATYSNVANSDFTSANCASCNYQPSMCIGDTASGPSYFYNVVLAR